MHLHLVALIAQTSVAGERSRPLSTRMGGGLARALSVFFHRGEPPCARLVGAKELGRWCGRCAVDEDEEEEELAACSKSKAPILSQRDW